MEPVEPLSLGELLKLARWNKNIGQSVAAEALGVHKNTIANYEKGVHAVPPERLRQLEELYEVPQGYFDDPTMRILSLSSDLQQVKKNTEEILDLLRSKKRRA